MSTDQASPDVGRLIERVIQSVAELSDRTSPDDQPNMMLVTGAELEGILRHELAALQGGERPRKSSVKVQGIVDELRAFGRKWEWVEPHHEIACAVLNAADLLEEISTANAEGTVALVEAQSAVESLHQEKAQQDQTIGELLQSVSARESELRQARDVIALLEQETAQLTEELEEAERAMDDSTRTAPRLTSGLAARIRMTLNATESTIGAVLTRAEQADQTVLALQAENERLMEALAEQDARVVADVMGHMFLQAGIKLKGEPKNGDEVVGEILEACRADRADQAIKIETLEQTVQRLTEAIRWALGEVGEFGEEPPPLAGKYRRRFWWRTELRKRAALAPPSETPRQEGKTTKTT